MRALFEPTKIGSLEVRNRIVMPAMATTYPTETGGVSDRLIAFHEERSRGGVGLIVVEGGCVDSPTGNIQAVQLRIDGDQFTSGLNQLVEAVHLHGAKIALQLNHAGRQTTMRATGGVQPVSSTEAPTMMPGLTARPLTVEEIKGLVEAFAEAARRAKAAGFDAIELQFGHAYLVDQFVSPVINKRTDQYGGSLENRIRFPLEILRRTREVVGSDYPIIVRFTADDFKAGGTTLESATVFAQQLQENGADALNVSSATLGIESDGGAQPMAMPRGHLVYLAEGIKRVAKVPVIAVGRVNDPELADAVIGEGKTDLVAMGRALIADPELPNKARAGRWDDILRCIACQECIMRRGRGLGIMCAVNAAVGREREYQITPAPHPKKVLVVGGGPAGMEAARVAALRGHQVTLWEKGSRLGGQLILGGAAASKREICGLLDYLTVQVEKLGVKIDLGKEATAQAVKGARPDAVILATGASPLVPRISGVDLPHVVNGWDVLAGKAQVGDGVVIAGGGLVGCELAEYLGQGGKKVAIVEMLKDLAPDLDPRSKFLMMRRFAEFGVQVHTETKIEAITPQGVTLSSPQKGSWSLEAQSVVLALGATPNNSLSQALQGEGLEVHTVGDAVSPRKMFAAIHEGSYAGRQV